KKGAFLYAADQGSNNLSGYSIGTGGGISLLVDSPFVTGAQPGVLASDPAGKYLFVGTQKSIESFSLNTSTGDLTSVGTYTIPQATTSSATTFCACSGPRDRLFDNFDLAGGLEFVPRGLGQCAERYEYRG